MNPLEDIIETFSPSRLQTLATCHYRFFRRYILGEPGRVTSSMAVGTAFDETANICYADAKEQGSPFTDGDKAAEVFAWQWEQQKEEVEEWLSKPGEILDQGVKLARHWTWQVASQYLPVYVQADWTLKFPGVDWKVRGVLDLVAQPVHSRRLILADTKCTGRRWRASKVWYSLQPPAYSLGSEAVLEKPIEEFQFHIGVRKKMPEVQIEVVPVGQKERAAYVKKVAYARSLVADLYKTGVWLPTARDSGHFMCSRKYCPYWEECEKEWGGKVVE